MPLGHFNAPGLSEPSTGQMVSGVLLVFDLEILLKFMPPGRAERKACFSENRRPADGAAEVAVSRRAGSLCPLLDARSQGRLRPPLVWR